MPDISLRTLKIRTIRYSSITDEFRTRLSIHNANLGRNCQKFATSQYDGTLRINIDTLAMVGRIKPEVMLNELASTGTKAEEMEIKDHGIYLAELKKKDPALFQSHLIKLWIEGGQTLYPVNRKTSFVFLLEEKGIDEMTDDKLISITARAVPNKMRFMADPPQLFDVIGHADIRDGCNMGFGIYNENDPGLIPPAIKVFNSYRDHFRGIGSSLVIFALHYAKSHGYKYFNVNEVVARGFYRRLGFSGYSKMQFNLNNPIPGILIKPSIKKYWWI